METPGRELIDHALQRDVRDFIENRLGEDTWFTAYYHTRSDKGNAGFGCALVPSDRVEVSLGDSSWDEHPSRLVPECFIVSPDGVERAVYERFGNTDGIEPLVIPRHFHGLREPFAEVAEEFRHFHNLFEDRKTGSLTLIDEVGDEHVVARYEDGKLRIRMPQVRRFLALKEMHLALYFDIVRYSVLSLDQIPEGEQVQEFAEGLTRYSFYMSTCDFARGEHRVFSRILGKKLIAPFPKSECGRWPYEDREKQHEEFIIGLDEVGSPLTFTCEPDSLRNNFGANPDAPHFLHPVYFKPTVLQKYYENPDKFSVKDGHLYCGGLWSLPIDNNQKDWVVVFLGDLGDSLPYAEQKYWRSFNVAAEGGISSVNYRRSILAEFADPERADLLFKLTFERFQEQWTANLGWPLFKALSGGDQHYYDRLRIPLSEGQAEFDSQVQALSKLLVESLNEAELAAAVSNLPPNAKSISKLEAYLTQRGATSPAQSVKYLRDLQELRSGIPHRKGEKYEAAAVVFRLQELGMRAAFEQILNGAISLLGDLGEVMLRGQSE